jgi:hypothetical protein
MIGMRNFTCPMTGESCYYGECKIGVRCVEQELKRQLEAERDEELTLRMTPAQMREWLL